jgi:hypothetical protein
MGIHGLTKLLGDNAHEAIKEQKFENYFGRKIAVDASMHIYQFLVVVGRQARAAERPGRGRARGGSARSTRERPRAGAGHEPGGGGRSACSAFEPAVRPARRTPAMPRQGDQLLTSETGEVTSHLQGMFYRTTRLLEAGARRMRAASADASGLGVCHSPWDSGEEVRAQNPRGVGPLRAALSGARWVWGLESGGWLPGPRHSGVFAYNHQH